MKSIILITTFILSLIFSNICAQNSSSSTLMQRDFQISFIHPIGTNGIDASGYENKLSLNILAGYAGGLSGVEFGGFSNIISENVQGIQLAGFDNIVGNNFEGFQSSGFVNIVNGKSDGAQFTGFTNIVRKKGVGIQLAGFSNIAGNDYMGIQACGFVNFVGKELTGAQLAGFTNISKDASDGFQIAGFANIVSNNFHGAQVCGFLNIAQNLNGLQLGVINISDSVGEGIPIGFLSIVKKGYHKIEISSNETFNINIGLKTGMEQFYNIFSFGMKVNHGNHRWGIGYGVGTKFRLYDKIDMNIDLSTHGILNNDWWDHGYHSLNKLEITISKQFEEHLTIFVGPSFNMNISNKKDSEGNLIDNNIAPWTSYETIRKNRTKINMYPGFRVGFRF
jgi:hypothetical protein